MASCCFALGGWIYALRRRWRAEALHLPCIVIVTLLVIVAGGRVYVYSVLPLAVLSVTGLPALDAALGRLWPARRKAALIAVSALLCVGLSYPLWNRSLGQGRDNVFAYRLVEIMDPVPDATLLDLGTLDSGLYTAGDFDPITPYFCRLNLVTPEMREEWRRIIRNGEADYIYTGDQTLATTIARRRNRHLCAFVQRWAEPEALQAGAARKRLTSPVLLAGRSASRKSRNRR